MNITPSSLFIIILAIASAINIITITYFHHTYHPHDVFQIMNDGIDISGKEEILSILKKSGVEITNDLIERMPTLHNFTSMYGSSIKIIGLDTCKDFQNNISPLQSFVSPAGVYNTGTNLIYQLMKEHCVIQERVDAYDKLHQSEERSKTEKNNNDEPSGVRIGIFDDAPWGKHSPVSWRDDESYRPDEFKINQVFRNIQSKNVFPIVMIKDPYSWMGSMCRHNYGSQWLRSPHSCLNLNEEYDRYDVVHDLTDPNRKIRGKRNPLLSSSLSSRGGIKFNAPQEKKKKQRVGLIVEYSAAADDGRWRREVQYENLVDLWNIFYNDYVNATFPRLIVRYEDLLLHADQVIPQVCDCVGGTLVNTEKNGIALSKDSVKDKRLFGETSNLVESLTRYGSSKLRIADFSKGDLVYTNDAISKELMEMFGYTFPKLEYEDEGLESVIQIQRPRDG